MNSKKNVLIPSQQTVFLRVHLDSIQMQVHLAPAWIFHLNTCLARFKMYTKMFLLTTATKFVSTSWPQNECQIESSHLPSQHTVSLTGWGAIYEDTPACRVWTGEFLSWHKNSLELRVFYLGQIHFLHSLQGVSHDCQEGQHGGGILYKLPRGVPSHTP